MHVRVHRDVAQGQSATAMFQEFVKAAKGSHGCPLCERPFTGASETQQFVTTVCARTHTATTLMIWVFILNFFLQLEQKMAQTPEQIEQLRKRLSVDETQLKVRYVILVFIRGLYVYVFCSQYVSVMRTEHDCVRVV